MKTKIFLTALFLGLCANAKVSFAQSITLDTGHTAKKVGAISPYGKGEFSYNREITQQLATKLAKNGINVSRVPTNNPDLTLLERTQVNPKSDLFVSIHHDAFPESLNSQREHLQGYSIFVSALNPQSQTSYACAKQVALALQQAGEIRSTYHELLIEGESKQLLSSLGVYRYDNLVVLKHAPQAAVLIEVGVIANPLEALRLQQSATQEKLVNAIAFGIQRCLKKA